MTIAVIDPNPTGTPRYPLGPLIELTGTISGPTALHDAVLVELFDNRSGGELICRGLSQYLLGFNVWTVLIGSMGADGGFDNPPRHVPPDGTVLSVQIHAYHWDTGVVFDSVNYVGQFSFTSAGSFSYAAQSSGSHDPMLDTILAAVRRTFHSP